MKYTDIIIQNYSPKQPYLIISCTQPFGALCDTKIFTKRFIILIDLIDRTKKHTPNWQLQY